MARISMRARCAPRQKWRPKPNARWLEALARVTSSRNGSSKTSSSRFADAYESSSDVAGLERDVAERERLPARPDEVLHRGDVADELVGRAVDQLGLVLQQLQLVGVLDEREQAAGDRVRRGVVPGGGDDEVEAEHVHVGQGLRRRARRWR